jgi:serine protease
MSLGGNVGSEIEDAYYSYLYEKGFLIVAAAGNEGNDEYSYPASHKAVSRCR